MGNTPTARLLVNFGHDCVLRCEVHAIGKTLKLTSFAVWPERIHVSGGGSFNGFGGSVESETTFVGVNDDYYKTITQNIIARWSIDVEYGRSIIIGAHAFELDRERQQFLVDTRNYRILRDIRIDLPLRMLSISHITHKGSYSRFDGEPKTIEHHTITQNMGLLFYPPEIVEKLPK